MPAIERDITIEIGSVWDSPLALKNADGTPYDLTGAEGRMQIRDPDGALLAELSTANGRLVFGGALGTITRRLGATITAAISGEKGFYDMEIMPGGVADNAWKLYRGKVKFLPEQTHD